MILENTVKEASQLLKKNNISSYELDAQIILSNILGVTKEFLFFHLYPYHYLIVKILLKRPIYLTELFEHLVHEKEFYNVLKLLMLL